jgi:2-amino-4-hydroxy-6-hydroxymethyldihydropteridine diphosphokinase
MTLSALSSVYGTEPIGHVEQPEFWNMVVLARTELPAEVLLHTVKRLEPELGRVASFRMGPRAIDIDILLYGDTIIETAILTVPHPGLCERAFVLVPLLELDAALRDPRTGEPLADCAARLPEQGVRRIGAAAELLPLPGWMAR